MARNAKQGHPQMRGPAGKNVRRRPTLPQPLGCSTIGAERLNFRVRDGTGCFPFAMAAVTLAETHAPNTRCLLGVFPSSLFSSCVSTNAHLGWFVGWELRSGRGHHQSMVCCGDVCVGQALGLLVPVGWALLLYTSGLSTQCSAGGLTRLIRWETSS